MITAQMRTDRYEDLTASELAGLEAADARRAFGGRNQARRILELALDFEHHISTLPLDPEEIDSQMTEQVRRFRDEFKALTGVNVLLNLFNERRHDVEV